MRKEHLLLIRRMDKQIARNSMLIILLVFFANTILLAQKTSNIEFRIGAIGQGYIYKKSLPNLQHIFRYGVNHGTAASSGAGGLVSFMWHTEKFTFSISPALRYAVNKIMSSYRYEPRIDGFVADVHLSAQYNIKSNSWLLNNSSLGVGVSLINIGQPFDEDYEIRLINSKGTTYLKYHVSSLQFPGIHAFYERRFGKRISVKATFTYSAGVWAKWSPLTQYLVHGALSVQYSFFKHQLKKNDS